MASAVDSRLAYARLSAVATASRLPTATRGSNNSYTTSWDTTRACTAKSNNGYSFASQLLRESSDADPIRCGFGVVEDAVFLILWLPGKRAATRPA